MKKNALNIVRDIVLLLLILASSTLIGFYFRHWELHETNIVVVYIFSVLLISLYPRISLRHCCICGFSAVV
ncbi:MAG: hypothetical protein IJC48_01835 [Clostridia bacterium]|nr:hypothetical protein [Clostridia bacterium]